MRFIRDIIAEKTQAASQEEATALRYPLQLREQDRAGTETSPTPSMHIEAHSPPAPAHPPQQVSTPKPQTVSEDTEATLDLSAISAALSEPSAPKEPEATLPDIDAPQEKAEEPVAFENGFAGGVEERPGAQDTYVENPQASVRDPTAESPKTSPGADAMPAPEQPTPAMASPNASLESSKDLSDPAPVPQVDLAALQANITPAKPNAGRGSKGRVKTRLLGFSAPASQAHDPMAQTRDAPASAQAQFPVGWLVVVDGPGTGASFSLFDGLTQVGRGEGQSVRLDFGDTTISRENHAAIAFDREQRQFFFGHGGKANLVRLNGRPVLSTETLDSGSLIRIGETTLRFVALCGDDFVWGDTGAGHENLG